LPRADLLDSRFIHSQEIEMNKPLLNSLLGAAALSLSLSAFAADPPSPSTGAPDSGPASMKPERVDPAAERGPSASPSQAQEQLNRRSPATAAPDSGPVTMKPGRIERDARRAAMEPNRTAAEINGRNPATAAPDSGPDTMKPDRAQDRRSMRDRMPGERSVQ